MAFVVDLDSVTDKQLSALVALHGDRGITKSEFTARLIRFAIETDPTVAALRESFAQRPAQASIHA